MDTGRKSYNVVEKISFALGLVVLVALVSFLVYQMVQKQNVPPILELSIVEEPLTPDYDFIIEVKNVGEETAESISIVLNLYQEGIAVEESMIRLQYIPIKSKKTAWIVFGQKEKLGDSVIVSSITFVKP